MKEQLEQQFQQLKSDYKSGQKMLADLEVKQANLLDTLLTTYSSLHLDSSGTCVTGMILMWSGSVNAVPSGWALCNGQNGTPNLVDRFILGASEDASARAGGTSSHSHSTGQGNNATRDVLTGVAAAGKNFDNVSDEVHSHSVSESSHVPPFYKLAFIMKL
jgi:Phage Tail Collar Domain